LIDLLKRHPSFRVDDQGNIYVDGKKIERAMLNGKHVFGEDVRAMVHSILAKEAGLIKVYDENDETSEILKGEEFADKRKVMNVITFKDFNLFKGGEVRLEGGLYADEDADGDRQTMHAARGKLGQYASHFRIAVDGNTRKTAFPREWQETGAKFNAEVSTPDLLKMFGTRYDYGRDDRDQESRTRQTYFPTSYFETQIVDRDYNSRQDKDAHAFSLTGKYVKKKEFSLSGGYSGTLGTTGDRTLSVSNLERDGERSSYLQQLKESRGRNANHVINLQCTRSLKKAGNIQFAMNGGFDKKSSDGGRVDTSYSGGMAERRVFNTFTKAPYYRLSADLIYSKNFKKYSAGYDPSVFYQYWDQSYRVLNGLTGEVDSTTTRDQTRKDLRISNRLFFNALLKDGGLISTRITYNLYQFQLEERFPGKLQMDKNFYSWNVWFDVVLNKCSFTFQTSDNPFPVSYLSTRLRDDNPLNLIMGNPNLKMGKNYIFTCRVDLKEVLKLKLEYKMVTDPILQSRRYFATNTSLPEFDHYEALAGAVLERPVNAKDYNYFEMTLQSNSKRGFMLLRGFLNYVFEDPETDLLGEICRSRTHRTLGSLSLTSNFSSSFRLDLTDRVSYGHTRIKAEEPQDNSRISNFLTGKASLQLFYRMMVNADYTYSTSRDSRTKHTNNRQTLNASIDYRIFPDRRGLISLNAYNLLNTKSSLTTTGTDLYIQNTYRPENSTLVTLSFQYKFGVEQ